MMGSLFRRRWPNSRPLWENNLPSRPAWKGKSGKISTSLDLNSGVRDERQSEMGVTDSRIGHPGARNQISEREIEMKDYLNFHRIYPQIVGTASAQLHSLLPNDFMGESQKVPTTLARLALPPQRLINSFSYSWYEKNVMTAGDNPPVGILLCTQKDHALVEYALAGISNRLFISKYQLNLPKKEEMQRFIEKQIKVVRDEI